LAPGWCSSMEQQFEIAIIGGGPAGLAAGLYAARATRSTVCFERKLTGGQIALTSRVENYPGFPEGIDGYALAQQMEEQAVEHGMVLRSEAVLGIQADGKAFRIVAEGGDLLTNAVIVTAGADYNRLGVPGEERLTGRGVSYCATCDAAFFRDKTVAVVGGGDAALDEGLFVARYASKIFLIHRRDQLRGARILQERVFADPKFHLVWDTVVESIEGESEVVAVRINNVKTGERSVLDVAAVFVFIGQHPNSDFLGDLAPLDGGGHLLVDHWMRTARPGLFAAGDIRAESSRQLVSAAGDGATAAIAADHYLSEHFPRRGAD
jgi:thioredoxin reductase (NADPH)